MKDLDELAKAAADSNQSQPQQPATAQSGENQSLMYCRDCRGIVSTTARRCPHCGRQFKASAAGIIITVIIIVIVLAILQFIGQMVQFNRAYPTP